MIRKVKQIQEGNTKSNVKKLTRTHRMCPSPPPGKPKKST